MAEDWDQESFFKIHADLPREGPGETADVAWAVEVASTPQTARILDAASGPGGDLGALLRAAPQGHVTAIDLHAPFIEAAQKRWGQDSRVSLIAGDYLSQPGPFDFIWCAGAVYFVGIETALAAWAKQLAPGGAVAFSEPCFFTDTPSEAARAFWAGEGVEISTEAGIVSKIEAAGYRVLATRRLNDIAWESYYRPVETRLEALRPGADAKLQRAIAETEAEIAAWRACRAETGYLLSVVAPAT